MYISSIATTKIAIKPIHAIHLYFLIQPDIKLAAGDTIEEVKFPLLNITAPQLWNPWTHGVPFLYSASFEFVVDSAGAGGGGGGVDTDADAVGENTIVSGGEQASVVMGKKQGHKKKEPFISDTATINFGIRTTESFIHPTTKGRPHVERGRNDQLS